MKTVTFSSFKGGAGKTTAAMALASTLDQMGKRTALIDADENMPLLEWRDSALKAGTWSDAISVYEADDLRAFEEAIGEASASKIEYALIDTRGGGSELNNACLINTDLVIIPSALTTLDMTQALSTFQHVIELHQSIELAIPTALLIQRVPVGKLTKSQRTDLEALSELPCCETQLHNRDAYATLAKRGLMHKVIDQMRADPMQRIGANHMATAIAEAKAFTGDILEAFGDT